MKKIILLFIVLTAYGFPQATKPVWSKALKDSVQKEISDSLYHPANDSSILMYYGGAFHDLTFDSTKNLLGVDALEVRVENDSSAKLDSLSDHWTAINTKLNKSDFDDSTNARVPAMIADSLSRVDDSLSVKAPKENPTFTTGVNVVNGLNTLTLSGNSISAGNTSMNFSTNAVELSGGLVEGQIDTITVSGAHLDIESYGRIHHLNTNGSNQTVTQINGVGYVSVGQIITLRSIAATDTITFEDGTDNIQLSAKFEMEKDDTITLYWDGFNYIEISRSKNKN